MALDPEFTRPEHEATITIAAPARLHMGFLDMSGDLGRRFGGLGLALSEVQTRLSVQRAKGVAAEGPSSERAARSAQAHLQALGIAQGVRIQVHEAIPEHAGLGSGTQLSLAVGAALARLFERDCHLPALAQATRRGLRSGIGIGTFDSGGFVVDGGHGERTMIPPVIAQMPFPGDWRVIVILDRARRGLNGAAESAAFKRLAPMAPETAGRLCRLLVMQVLPALAERDFVPFSAGIAAIQDAVGDHFASLQGGRYTSPAVAEVLAWLRAQGVTGVGQSSWGPTGFALCEDPAEADRLVRAACPKWTDSLTVLVCTAQNRGAEVMVKRKAA
ncbi:MAG: beta-ribofuranosylaminobenzene 5'-phosphate synthase family protein [Gammaproteobacteria bacterium]